MKIVKTSTLALVCGCLLALAAPGCGQTPDSIDTQAGAADLRGKSAVGAAHDFDADGGKDRDKDVDELADEAADPSSGAAGSRPAPGPRAGRGADDADADGGVDERDCQRSFGLHNGHGAGGGFSGFGGKRK